MKYYYPSHTILKKLIRYISFYYSEQPAKEYLVFPNNGSGLVLSRNLEFEVLDQNTYLSKEMPGAFRSTLHVNRMQPVKIMERGRQEKITIVFEPLGISHFIRQPLFDFVVDTNSPAQNLDLTNSFHNMARSVFSCSNRNERMNCIEEYLLNRFADPAIPFLPEALELLKNLDHSYSIEEISKMLHTSSRNLLRLFKKHLCLSPVEFRNIYRFRFSLQKKMQGGDTTSFKDISYESSYSDASYMVRMYKKFTGLNPSEFFGRIDDDKYVIVSL